MKNCGSLLEKEINRRKVTRRELCEYIGTSPQNMSKILRKESIDAGLLEKFCEYLNIDPTYFFDFRPYPNNAQEIGDVKQTNLLSQGQINITSGNESIVEKLLAEKDARIATLEKLVSVYENGLSK